MPVISAQVQLVGPSDPGLTYYLVLDDGAGSTASIIAAPGAALQLPGVTRVSVPITAVSGVLTITLPSNVISGTITVMD